MNTNTNEINKRIKVTNWDPVINVQKRSEKRSELHRKVLTNGIKTIPCEKLLERATTLLRQGFEVRLGEAIRLYPLASSDCKTIYVAAHAMKGLSHSLFDKKIGKVVNCGEEVDAEKVVKEAKERNENYKKNHLEVTPDTMVTCPNCGEEFRVGRSITNN